MNQIRPGNSTESRKACQPASRQNSQAFFKQYAQPSFALIGWQDYVRKQAIQFALARGRRRLVDQIAI